MSRVLVTGAAGFLGSHLCDALIDAGYTVVGVDNLRSGLERNLHEVSSHDRFTFVERDVTHAIDVSGPLDWVLHLASLASPKFYSRYPIETLSVGARGTHQTLEVAREKNAGYLFTSTSEVYGDPDVHPQPERYRGNVDPYGPRSCYDESKRYGEALVRAYRDQYDLDVRVARLFNTYGPRMRLDDGRVVPTFVRQALVGEDLTVYGDGSQTRSFCYVSDLIDGLLRLLSSDLDTPVNIGNPDERTILDLAELIVDLTDSRSEITFEPLPEQDPQVRKPDITKAKRGLGWTPAVDLDTGLRRSIADIEQALERAAPAVPDD